MFAALPMYDRPENRAAHDALWAGIRDALRARDIAAPEALDRTEAYDTGWARPDLVLGQICNLPYRARFRGRVTAIGTACYGLPDTPAGHYFSHIIVRADDPATKLADCTGYRVAINDALSNSGWGALYEAATTAGLRHGPVERTGAHAASLHAVAEGRADLVAIDAITWWRLANWDDASRAVKIIGRTATSPGMTFITADATRTLLYFDAIAEAIADLAPDLRDVLGLRGIVRLSPAAYDLPLPPDPLAAVSQGAD
jgi:ABC-type phosphate/phosphonate transport system substrate-binding protein